MVKMRAVLATKQRRIQCSGCKHYEKLNFRKELSKQVGLKRNVPLVKTRDFEYNKQ